MRRGLQIGAMCLACAALTFAFDQGTPRLSSGGEIVDRVIATVNGQPILQSDWDIELRCEAFLDQRPLQFTPEAGRASLDRLVDQELLRQQIRTFQLQPAGDDRLHARLDEIRRQIPGAASDAGWQAALRNYGLTQSEVEDRVADQVEILHFVEIRLRPTVHVDRRSIETYYYDTLLPQLRAKGAKQAPLVEVSAQIEEILSQQALDSLLSDLLRDLRQQSEIRIDDAAMSPPATTAARESR
jgi:hypothetical protein